MATCICQKQQTRPNEFIFLYDRGCLHRSAYSFQLAENFLSNYTRRVAFRSLLSIASSNIGKLFEGIHCVLESTEACKFGIQLIPRHVVEAGNTINSVAKGPDGRYLVAHRHPPMLGNAASCFLVACCFERIHLLHSLKQIWSRLLAGTLRFQERS